MWEGYTTAHRTRVRHMRHARLEAGRLQRMRHARARLEIVVVRIEAVSEVKPDFGCWAFHVDIEYALFCSGRRLFLDPRCARCATRDAWQAVPEYAEKPRSLRRLIVHESRGQPHRRWLRRYYHATRRPSPRPSEGLSRGEVTTAAHAGRGQAKAPLPGRLLFECAGWRLTRLKAVVRTSAACG